MARALTIAAVLTASIGTVPTAGVAPAAAEEAKLDFKLPDTAGRTVTLKEYLDRGPVLVAFWATWCKPCKKELPHLEALYKEFGPRGFTVVAISEDQAKSASKVKPFVDANRFTFPVLLDTNGDAKRRFNANFMPTIVLLDRTGKKVYSHIGYNPGDEKALRDKVVALLSGEAAPGDTTGTGAHGG